MDDQILENDRVADARDLAPPEFGAPPEPGAALPGKPPPAASDHSSYGLELTSEAADHLTSTLAAGYAAQSESKTDKGNLILLGTMVLFGLSFLTGWSATNVLLLIAVVLLHELGHAAAMKLFGYRDVRVFFIPFLGAATTGRPTAPNAFASGIVDLAGPVPGIVLAGVLVATTAPSPVMNSFIELLLLLNVLNLLPLPPLDGGRLMETTLLNRHPAVETVFRFGAGGAFLWGAIALQSFLVGLLALLAFNGAILALRTSGRGHRLRKRWPSWPMDPAELDAEQRLALLTESTAGQVLPARTALMAAGNLHRRAGRRFPGWLGTTALGIVWVLAVVGTIAIAGLNPHLMN